MARPASTYGFYPESSMNGQGAPATVEFIIDDTKTIAIGDMVKVADGFADLAGAAASIAGCVVGIVDQYGIPFQCTEADADGTKSNDIQYISASDNTTDEQVRVQCVVDQNIWFYGEADSTLTTGELYEFFELTSASDRVTGTGSTTQAQMQLMKIDGVSGTATHGWFRIAESEFPQALTA